MCRKFIPLALLAGVLLVFAAPLFADQPSRVNTSQKAQATTAQKSGSGVIDITGFMEWPKGDTRIAWGRPQSFSRGTDLVFGLRLKADLFRTVDREGVLLQQEAERLLGR